MVEPENSTNLRRRRRAATGIGGIIAAGLSISASVGASGITCDGFVRITG
jgi:hypothetical protein